MSRKIYRSSLTKRQRAQYDNLVSRGFEITPEQVREYFREARLINKEYNKKIEDRFVEEIKISKDLTFAKNQEQLDRWLHKNEYYADSMNRAIDDIEKNNVLNFTLRIGDIYPELEKLVAEMTPKQLKDFISKPENYRYRDLMYASLTPDLIDDIINLTNSIYGDEQGLEEAFKEVMDAYAEE